MLDKTLFRTSRLLNWIWREEKGAQNRKRRGE